MQPPVRHPASVGPTEARETAAALGGAASARERALFDGRTLRLKGGGEPTPYALLAPGSPHAMEGPRA